MLLVCILQDPLNVTVTSLPGPLTSALQKTLWMISKKPNHFTPRELLNALGKRLDMFHLNINNSSFYYCITV